MQKNWKQVLLAFLMGMVMPALIVFPMSAQKPQIPPKETTSMGQNTTATAPAVTIPVLHNDGIVRQMALDDYIFCVVLAEMPASFEAEALKAQAVAARTVALRCTQSDNRHSGAICTDSRCCQAYMAEESYRAAGGTDTDIAKIRAAVRDTTGQVLTYDGELIEATYFSCSGGYTEDAAAVWGSDVPYLQAVASPGEEQAEKFRQTVSFSSKEFADRLGRGLTGSCESWLGAVTRTEGGGVGTMIIGGKTYKGTELRTLLGLNSTAFTITAQGQTVTVTTSGWGHRVGMSQYGADAMAVAGSTYEQILAYYYQGTRIDKMPALG